MYMYHIYIAALLGMNFISFTLVKGRDSFATFSVLANMVLVATHLCENPFKESLKAIGILLRRKLSSNLLNAKASPPSLLYEATRNKHKRKNQSRLGGKEPKQSNTISFNPLHPSPIAEHPSSRSGGLGSSPCSLLILLACCCLYLGSLSDSQLDRHLH